VPANCDRACLEGLVDRYLAAVVAHDPAPLPLSADVKIHGERAGARRGDGFWHTRRRPRQLRALLRDPATSQAAWMGTMREGATVLLMALRLRVELGRITEIETSYFRPGGGGPNDIAAMDARGKPEPLWLETVPAAKRSTRHELVEVANAYFEGVQRNDGKGFLSVHRRLRPHRERRAHH